MRRRRRKDKKTEAWVKASLLFAMFFLLYVTFFWSQPKELPKKEGKPLLKAVYRAPKFQLAREKKEKQVKTEAKAKEEKLEKKLEKSPKKKQTEQTPKQTPKEVYHLVEPGDSLWKLGKKYYGSGLKGELIYQANRHLIPNKNVLPVGKRLKIPRPTRLVQKKERERGVKKEKFVRYVTYKVQHEDTLSTISEEFYGTPRKWYLIWRANRKVLKNPNFLRAGMVLKIPVRKGERP